MLTWKFKRLLIKILLTIVATFILVNAVKAIVPTPKEEMVRVFYEQQVSDKAQYIINKEMILGKLQSKNQIVSLEQSLENTFTHVDDGFLGKRHTDLTIKGSYKMGLETSGIKVTQIDNETGIIHIDLPEPILISLDLPFDAMEFDKTKGWLRLALDEEEEKKFYRAARTSIENDLKTNEDILRHAELFNQEAVRDLIKLIPVIKGVVFE